MAPTLLGQHWLVESNQTGTATPVGLGETRPDTSRLRDWQISRNHGLSSSSTLRTRMGDRIAVVKYVRPFFEPERYDVIVFKNPTIPFGDSANYIKRLVGMPGEEVWIVDGDVFIKKPDEDRYHIARKPVHVQDGVWQSVHDTRHQPVDPERLVKPWQGSPWIGQPESKWEQTAHGGFKLTTSGRATLSWDRQADGPDDWSAYNMISPVRNAFSVSDIRIDATLIPDESTLQAELTIETRANRFRFHVANAVAGVSMSPVDGPEDVVTVEEPIASILPGEPIRLECIHSDQSLRLAVNGRPVASLDYDWTPYERLANTVATPREREAGKAASTLAHRLPDKPRIWWSFDGSAVTIPRISMDRDLYYRPSMLTGMSRNWNEPTEQHRDAVRLNKPAAATHPDTVVKLGPDQYFVLGDNSGRSLDGRLWGAPHPLVAAQIDDTPFVVPGDLLIGKAWIVYYPAPHSVSDGGTGLIPDFGKIRFIR
ncbi:MAG: hypothetical protein CMJ29_11385 [Phycisphaerae bacterium]|nr:hypothetical protein [Phycisphaerae bacterium]